MYVNAIKPLNSALLLLPFLVLCLGDFPIVKTPYGNIQGKYTKSASGRAIESYLGVPYAKPPVGDLRFKEPQKASNWIGNYNASTYGSDCLQYSHFKYYVDGAEDCLFANIYTPLRTPENEGRLHPVVVHIHGGAFMFFGGREFSAEKIFDDNDIIYINFNYRLGPLGFMTSGDNVLPGNLGLKDQSFFLKWIKDNIKYFGGDPNQVTITGLSAGGASVHYHLLSPLSRGLFTRAVSVSGVAQNPWSFVEGIPQKTRVIASNLGCPTGDSKEMVACLNTRPAHQIVAQVPLFMKWLYNPYTPFGPTVEPAGTESAFLPRHPFDIIQAGDTSQVPWLVSLTTEEGLYPIAEFADNKKLLRELEKRWHEIAPHFLDFNYTVPVELQKDITEQISKHYLHGKTITKAVPGFIQMTSDRLFGAGIVQTVLMHASAPSETKPPVYMYQFSYRGKFSASESLSHTNTNFGVCHGDDMGYILNASLFRMDQTADDRVMTKNMINLWMSFIKKGVPEFPENVPLPIAQEGLPKLKYLDINSINGGVVKTVDDLANYKFWASLEIGERMKLPDSFKRDEL